MSASPYHHPTSHLLTNVQTFQAVQPFIIQNPAPMGSELEGLLHPPFPNYSSPCPIISKWFPQTAHNWPIICTTCVRYFSGTYYVNIFYSCFYAFIFFVWVPKLLGSLWLLLRKICLTPRRVCSATIPKEGRCCLFPIMKTTIMPYIVCPQMRCPLLTDRLKKHVSYIRLLTYNLDCWWVVIFFNSF